MWPAAMWIVVGVVMRRSHVETALAAGFAALPRQRIRRPAGRECCARAVLPREFEERLVSVTELALLALGAGELDGARA